MALGTNSWQKKFLAGILGFLVGVCFHDAARLFYLTYLGEAVSRGIGLGFVLLYFWFILLPFIFLFSFFDRRRLLSIVFVVIPIALVVLWCVDYYPLRVLLVAISSVIAFVAVYVFKYFFELVERKFPIFAKYAFLSLSSLFLVLLTFMVVRNTMTYIV